MLAASTMLAACGSEEEATSGGSGGGEGAEETSDFSVAMVTDVGGVDDKSFNQSAWEGLQKFGEENGLKKGDGGIDYLQSGSDADYNTNLNNLIRRDFDVVFGIGFLMEGAVKEIAAQQLMLKSVSSMRLLMLQTLPASCSKSKKAHTLQVLLLL